MSATLPISVHNTYVDLREAHQMRTITDLDGTPAKKTLPRGEYWYARRRIGDRIVERYIGPDNEETRRRIGQLTAEREDRKAFEKRCSLLVAQLRAAGLPALDRDTGKVLGAVAKCGAFRLGATLVGTHAFRLYDAELGVILPAQLGGTQDIDLAAFENLKLVINDTVDPTLAETFFALGLEAVPGLDRRNRPTRWRMRAGGAMVDFLAPKMQDRDDIVKLEPLGVFAQALPFLNFLIADPIPAVALYREGVLVQVPRPERYAVHKLIVAERRSGVGAAKAVKDRAQAAALIEILAADRPGELAAAWQTAHAAGPAWREALDAARRRQPDVVAQIDTLL